MDACWFSPDAGAPSEFVPFTTNPVNEDLPGSGMLRCGGRSLNSISEIHQEPE